MRDQDTYVYIDVSNIRLACSKTLGFWIDFVKLLKYFKGKYPNIKDVRYYEGIARGDMKKQRMFNYLAQRGYTICSLERKSYDSVEIEDVAVKCPRCKYEWVSGNIKKRHTMKSNVDVYLTADMLAVAYLTDHPIRIILVSCDGDYAEAIRNAIVMNPNVSIAVLATPTIKQMNKNTLSTKLKNLGREIPRYRLHNINLIRGSIESDKLTNIGEE